MAIHPIDLQTMYSQISNVAKMVSHQTEGVQLASAMQQNTIVQKTAEQVKTVQKTAQDDTKSVEVKADGQGQSQNGNLRKKKEQVEEDATPRKETIIRESYLGQHIDITR